VNGPRHQPTHRRVVRAGTPVARTMALAPIAVSATALATTTTAPTYDAEGASEEPVAKEVGCWAHARRRFFDAQLTDRDRALVAPYPSDRARG
jgi:hypothetical protein